MSETIFAAVIMAGGSGERFWPLSRSERPKQLLRLASSEESLLQEAVSRTVSIFKPENLFIATGAGLEESIRAGDTRVPPENVFSEPLKRNTAGAMVWTAASLMARFGLDRRIVMAVLTADHRIGKRDRFRACVQTAMKVCDEKDALMTLGAPPTRPDTGFGYIEVDAKSPADTRSFPQIHQVRRFREKPNRETAEEFLATGRFLWNCGMFFWPISAMLREMDNVCPEFSSATRDIAELLSKNDLEGATKRFAELDSISIDYALMEKAENVWALRADFPWDDVGSWDSLDRTQTKDFKQNVTIGDPVLVDCKDCIVYNEPGAEEVAVGVVGLEDIIVVVGKDSVLVVAKDQAQDVKKVVAELKRRGSDKV